MPVWCVGFGVLLMYVKSSSQINLLNVTFIWLSMLDMLRNVPDIFWNCSFLLLSTLKFYFVIIPIVRLCLFGQKVSIIIIFLEDRNFYYYFYICMLYKIYYICMLYLLISTSLYLMFCICLFSPHLLPLSPKSDHLYLWMRTFRPFSFNLIIWGLNLS